MKNNIKILFFIFALIFAINSVAQEKLKQNDIDSLYVKSIEQRFDWLLSSGYKYVDIENQSEAPKKTFTNGVIKILPQKDIIKISRKENTELTVYTLSYIIISKDTVDINFGEYKLKGLKKKGRNSPVAEIAHCKCGTLNYNAVMRFILVNNEWKVIKTEFK